MLKRLIQKLEYQLDKLIVSGQYFRIFRKKINWQKPKLLTEKLQVLKIDPAAEKLWTYVDKYEVRKFIKKTIGGRYLPKLYGVYQSPESINLRLLPRQFVLKPTHGSGWEIICKNKNQFDWPEAKKKLNHWLQINYYKKFREKSYKLIKPRIICEQFLKDKKGEAYDYKFFCFHGRPKLIQVDLDRFIDHTQNFYTPSWKKVPIARRFPVFKKKLTKPKKWKEMLGLAITLSTGFPHVRVDLYNLDGRIYFGEMTFSSFAGFPVWKPGKYNQILGRYLKI